MSLSPPASPRSSSTSNNGSILSSSWLPHENDCIVAARECVRGLFHTSESLSRVNDYLREYTRKQTESQTQLSQAVATQMEEIKRGITTIKQTGSMISRIRTNFTSIDEYCKQVKSLFIEYDLISRVNTGRKNVDATIRLLDKFRTLPVQCDKLLDELDSNDRHIAAVYLKLRHLMHLRATAFSPSLYASFSEEFASQLKDSFADLLDASDEVELRIWENISDCTFLAKEDPTTLIRTLQVIEMEDAAKRKVFNQHKLGGEKEKESTEAQHSAQQSPTPMRDKCLLTLEKSIADSFAPLHKDEILVAQEKKEKAKAEKKKKKEEKLKKKALNAEKLKKKRINFKEQQDREEEEEVEEEAGEEEEEEEEDDEEESEVGGSDVDEEDTVGADDPSASAAVSDYACQVLTELQDVVENLSEVTGLLSPCFPPSYDIITFFEQRYLHWIKVTLHFHTNDPSKLSKRALLQCVGWIHWYMDRVRSLDILDSSSERDFERMSAELTNQFCRVTESTITTLVDNLLRAEERAVAEPDEEGYYMTNGPADLFYTLNQQMDIVLHSYGLHSSSLASVCLMLADILTYYQNAQLSFLGEVELEEDILYFGKAHLQKPDTYFAAMINNSQQCTDNMDDLKDKCIPLITQQKSLPSSTSSSSSSSPSPSISFPTSASSPSYLSALSSRVSDAFDEVSEGFVNVASEAVDILVLQIMTTLQQPISCLFNALWLTDSNVSRDVTLTLSDFFTDYRAWIARPAYFSRIVHQCLHSLVSEYIRRLLEAKPTLSTTLHRRLQEDKVLFDDFFMKYSDLLSEHHITQELSLMQLAQDILHADADSMSMYFNTLIQRIAHTQHSSAAAAAAASAAASAAAVATPNANSKAMRTGGSSSAILIASPVVISKATSTLEGLLQLRTDLSRTNRKRIVEEFQSYISLEQAKANQTNNNANKINNTPTTKPNPSTTIPTATGMVTIPNQKRISLSNPAPASNTNTNTNTNTFLNPPPPSATTSSNPFNNLPSTANSLPSSSSFSSFSSSPTASSSSSLPSSSSSVWSLLSKQKNKRGKPSKSNEENLQQQE